MKYILTHAKHSTLSKNQINYWLTNYPLYLKSTSPSEKLTYRILRAILELGHYDLIKFLTDNHFTSLTHHKRSRMKKLFNKAYNKHTISWKSIIITLHHYVYKKNAPKWHHEKEQQKLRSKYNHKRKLKRKRIKHQREIKKQKRDKRDYKKLTNLKKRSLSTCHQQAIDELKLIKNV